MSRIILRAVLLLILNAAPFACAAGNAEHVVVLVWDGMRPDFISEAHTPVLFQLGREGVQFQNHHSVYCTSTEVNGIAIATGLYPEHSGFIGNKDYMPAVDMNKPVDSQNPDVIRKGDEITGGHYLPQPTVAEILQAAGRSSVIAGSKQVVLLHNRNPKTDTNAPSIMLYAGETVPKTGLEPIQKLLGRFPADAIRSSPDPNEPRDEWTTRALTESLWSNGIPAFTVLWLSEPDFSQHAAGPGSPKAVAAIESSDRKLAQVLAELTRRGARDKTDVFVVSDHGFSTIDKPVDVCVAVRNAGFKAFREFKSKPERGQILVVGQGGSVLFHIIGHNKAIARRLVSFLQQQDFAGVLMTRDPMPGTFTLAQALIASTQPPDVVLAMRWSPDASKTGAPGLQISDANTNAAGGNHASLSRFDIHNTLVAAGPHLKRSYVDTLPTGNTDLAPTVLWLLGVTANTPMDGRVLSEALTIEAPPVGPAATHRLEVTNTIGKWIRRQYLQVSQVNHTIYLDEGNGSLSPHKSN